MHFLRFFVATFILCLGGSIAAQEFTKFTSELDRFEIFTPVDLSMYQIEYDSEYGAVFPARVYGGEHGPNRYLSLIHI